MTSLANTAPKLFPERSGVVTVPVANGGPHLLWRAAPFADGTTLATDAGTVYRLRPDGTIDDSFGFGGVSLNKLMGQWGYDVGALAALPDGRSMVAAFTYEGERGSVALIRLLPDGKADPAFGANGIVTATPLRPGHFYQTVESVAVQADGKIVVLGHMQAQMGLLPGNFYLARFNPDGSFDNTFGHAGVILNSDTLTMNEQLVLQPDGSLLVAASETVNGNTAASVRHYLSDGALDRGYGFDGRISVSFGSDMFAPASYARAAVLQPDGSLLLGITHVGSSEEHELMMAVARVTPSGALDITFGDSGRISVFVDLNDNAGIWSSGYTGFSELKGMHLNADGSILLSGQSTVWRDNDFRSQVVMVKLLSNGKFDTAFNGDGMLTAGPMAGDDKIYGSLFLLGADDSLTVLGYRDQPGRQSYASLYLKGGALDPNQGTPMAAATASRTGLAPDRPVVISPHVTVADAELDVARTGYAGATLTLQRAGGANVTDQFGVTGAVALVGGHILVRDVDIGTATIAAGRLQATFTAAAGPQSVSAFMQAITYQSTAGSGTERLALKWTFDDGNSAGLQGPGGARQASFTSELSFRSVEVPYWIDERLGYTHPDQSAAAYRQEQVLLVNDGRLHLSFADDSHRGLYTAAQQGAIRQALAQVTETTGLTSGTSGVELTVHRPGDGVTHAGYRILDRSGGQVFYDFGQDTSAEAGATLTDLLLHTLGLDRDGPLADADIAALQYLYGPDPAVRRGDDVYRLATAGSHFLWDGGGNDTISAEGLAQDVTVHLQPGAWDFIGSKGSAITAAGQFTVNYGTVIENAIGGSGNDWLSGTAGANVLQGGAGQDHLAGLGGRDRLDGGDGIDTAVFAAKRSEATVKVVGGNGTVDLDSGQSTLVSIERLHFSDGDVAVDTGAAQLYRLYQAAFGRPADPSGFGYWLAAEGNGTSLDAIAATFLASPEFERRYGKEVSDAQFLTNLYQNVLHRTPDDSGYAFWIGKLDAHAISRTGILLQFTDSPENTAQLATIIAKGIDYLPYG